MEKSKKLDNYQPWPLGLESLIFLSLYRVDGSSRSRFPLFHSLIPLSWNFFYEVMDRLERDSEKEDVIRSDTVVTINPDRSGFLGEENRDLGNSNSNSVSNSRIEGDVLETVIVIDSDESERVNGETGVSESKPSEGLEKEKEKETVTPETPSSLLTKSLSSVDVKCRDGKGEGENLEVERMCRICHLSSGQSSEAATMTKPAAADLIHLGCCCKDELGIAHSHCAEAWFKFKGNRICEICGETATNVAGVGDSRFMEEWNEGRVSDGSRFSSERSRRVWRGQSFCNFLMACLVIAFVLPWFFRIDVF